MVSLIESLPKTGRLEVDIKVAADVNISARREIVGLTAAKETGPVVGQLQDSRNDFVSHSLTTSSMVFVEKAG